MKLKAFTYYQPLNELPPSNETRLILLWLKNWTAQDWDARVINEWSAMRHPAYNEFVPAYDALPTINPKGYDRACYLRWLAVAQELEPGELGLMVDYDVMNYGLDLRDGVDMDKVNILEARGCPCAVLATAENFTLQAERFSLYTPDEKDMIPGHGPHTSDMCILNRDLSHIQLLDWTLAFADEGWESKPLTHFPNAAMTPRGRTPRWEHVPQLRSLPV